MSNYIKITRVQFVALCIRRSFMYRYVLFSDDLWIYIFNFMYSIITCTV